MNGGQGILKLGGLGVRLSGGATSGAPEACWAGARLKFRFLEFTRHAAAVGITFGLCLVAPWAVGAPDPAVGATAAGAEAASTVTPSTGLSEPVVEIKTTLGAFRLQLDPGKAPLTVANFLKYVQSGHYDGTVFHRVVGGYMIQGGGFAKEGDRLVEKPVGPPIASEAGNGLKNLEGTVAMARSDVPDSATAQFFINCRDNEMLDQSTSVVGYAVFGRVIKGLEVVKQINEVRTGVREVEGRLGTGQLRPAPLKGVPLSDVVIESARVVGGTAGSAENPKTETPQKEE